MTAGSGRLSERSKGARYFLFGALLGGSGFYALLSLSSTWVNMPAAAGLIPAVAGVVACIWYLGGRRDVPFGRYGVQSNYHLAGRGRSGLVYFGALLGLGVWTEMSTPFVWVGVLFALTATPSNGFAYGLAFGLARSSPVLVATTRGGIQSPGSVIQAVTIWGRRALVLTPITALVCGVASLSS